MTVNDNEEDMLERILSYVDGETKIVQYGCVSMGVLFYSHKEDQQLWLQYDFDNPASVLLWHPVYDTGVVSV